MRTVRGAHWLALGLLLQACGSPSIQAGTTAAGGDTHASPVPRAGLPQTPKILSKARFFQLLPEEAYWVTHSDHDDSVVVAGARLRLSAHGEIKTAAWERDESGRNDMLTGSLAVLAHLGGGFVHWSNSRLFRSRDFTGPLEAIAAASSAGGETPMNVEIPIRGARNGLNSVIVFTDAGPRELLPGAMALSPVRDPALADYVAVNEKRAARLDLFGRTSFTNDGGAHWNDAVSTIGISPRGLAAGLNDLWIITWNGRIPIYESGKLGDPDLNYRMGFDFGRPFQIAFENTRAGERETWPWGFRDTPPLHAAIYGGAVLPDGSAIAISHGAVARVDLNTGEPLTMSSDWLPQGLECIPHGVADGILFVCTWESYQGYGGYVLRSERGEPPKLEKAFSDDGFFAADDMGSIGYVGSCKAEPRFIDPDERRMDAGEFVPSPVFCVRKSPGEWIERRIEVEENTYLIGWVPHRDGTASALIVGSDIDALPEAVSPHETPRVRFQSGVRTIRLYQEFGQFKWSRPSFRPYMYGRSSPPVYIDKRFQENPGDGSLLAWINRGDSYEGPSAIVASVRIASDGKTEFYPPPPDPSAIASTGDFALGISRDGLLYESTNHGQTWTRAGESPIPPQSIGGTCSQLGCVLSSVARVGWGTSELNTAITSAPNPNKSSSSASGPPLLSCEPIGTPTAIPVPEGSKARGTERRDSVSIPTGYGDYLEIIKENAGEPTEPPGPPAGFAPFGPTDTAPPPPGTATPSAPPAKGSKNPSKKASAAPLRTHSLLFRPPFDVDGQTVRLNATNASFGYRRTPATPVLGEKGEIALLLYAESTELLVTKNDVENLPPFETRRYFYGEGGPAPGLWLGPKRVMVLGDMRRRLSLEEHGSDPTKPPMYIGLDREQIRRRPLALGRKADGSIGILVLDGPYGERAGVAALDSSGTKLESTSVLASWNSLTPASDPACKNLSSAYKVLISIDPSRFFTLDSAKLPGVQAGPQGIALVQWGKERVCVEALDIVVIDSRRRAELGESHLIVRFDETPKAALGWNNLRQMLRCSVAAGSKEKAP